MGVKNIALLHYYYGVSLDRKLHVNELSVICTRYIVIVNNVQQLVY